MERELLAVRDYLQLDKGDAIMIHQLGTTYKQQGHGMEDEETSSRLGATAQNQVPTW